MSEKKLGQSPAFAGIEKLTGNSGYESLYYNKGMSKRFYAACAAMQGVLAGGGYYMSKDDAETLTHRAYEIADELLKQENDKT